MKKMTEIFGLGFGAHLYLLDEKKINYFYLIFKNLKYMRG